MTYIQKMAQNQKLQDDAKDSSKEGRNQLTVTTVQGTFQKACGTAELDKIKLLIKVWSDNTSGRVPALHTADCFNF